MDPLIDDYLRRIADIFLSAGAESLDELYFIDEGDGLARLEMTARFPGGRRLSVHARVAIQGDRPDLRRYSMHFMDRYNATIFRYDNTPHFHGAGDSRHYKHEGEIVFACPKPTIRQIRNEIADRLSANA